MSTTEDHRADAGVQTVDMKLEVIVIPVSDVDRAKEFYSRLGWRLDADVTGGELAGAMRRASAAHGEHERRIGHADPDWPDWYAEYMVAEQAGAELPS
jgi:catechol 2,3-dioxygenase-like lactoylglutathione lyase family enzyme